MATLLLNPERKEDILFTKIKGTEKYIDKDVYFLYEFRDSREKGRQSCPPFVLEYEYKGKNKIVYIFSYVGRLVSLTRSLEKAYWNYTTN